MIFQRGPLRCCYSHGNELILLKSLFYGRMDNAKNWKNYVLNVLEVDLMLCKTTTYCNKLVVIFAYISEYVQ